MTVDELEDRYHSLSEAILEAIRLHEEQDTTLIVYALLRLGASSAGRQGIDPGAVLPIVMSAYHDGTQEVPTGVRH